MKWSAYNIFYELSNGGFILYNYLTDSAMIMMRSLRNIINLHKDKIDDLSTIHPDLYNELKIRGYVICDDVDEQTSVWKTFARV